MQFYPYKFREIRIKRKIRIVQLAEEYEISRTSLWLWEKGKKVPSEKKVRVLAEALGISVDQISDLPRPPQHTKNEFHTTAKILHSVLNETTEHKSPVNLKNIKQLKNRYSTLLDNLLEHFEESIISLEIVNTLIHHNSISIYFKDVKHRYILASAEFLKRIEFPENKSIKNLTDWDVFPETEAMKNFSEDEKVINTGNSILSKEDFIPGSRKQKWGLISKVPVFDSAGKISGVIGSFVDITDRKKAEQINEDIINGLNFIEKDLFIAKGNNVLKYKNGIIWEKSLYLSKNENNKKFFKNIHPNTSLPDKIKYFIDHKEEGSPAIDLDTIKNKGKDVIHYKLKIPGTQEYKNYILTFYTNSKMNLYASVNEKDTLKDEIETILDILRKEPETNAKAIKIIEKRIADRDAKVNKK